MTTMPYRLKHPVKYREGETEVVVDSLDMRRPTGKDMLLIDAHQAQPMRLVLEMVAALSGQMMVVVERLDAEDIGPLAEIAFANVDGGPTTGKTPSAS